MAEKKVIVVEVNVDNSGAKKSLKDLYTDIETLKGKLEGAEIGSKEFKALASDLKGAQSEVKALEKQFKALAPQDKIESFARFSNGVVGGFAAATGAMALFGSENQKIEELMVKTQASVSLAMGARAVTEELLQGKIAKRVILEKLSTIQTGIATGAQVAYNVVVGATTGLLKILRVALISTGIGALVVGVGLLIANFDKVSKALEPLTKKILDFFAPIKAVLEYLNIIDTEDEKRLQAQSDRSAKRVELFKKEEAARSNQIAIAKAGGATEKEIAQQEIKLYADRFEAYRRFVADKIKSGQIITEDEAKQLQDYRQALELRAAEYKNANDKELEEQRKTANDKAEERRKEYAEYLKAIHEDLLNARINAIVDAEQREKALLKKAHEDKLATIKGNSKEEIELRKLLGSEYEKENNAITTTYSQQRGEKAANDATERIQKEFDSAKAREELILLDKAATDAEKYEAQKELIQLQRDESLSNQQLTLDEQRLIVAQSEQQITDLQARAAQDRYTNQQQKLGAMVSLTAATQSTLQSLTELGVVNGKKANAAQKALALTMIAIDTAKAISNMVVIASQTASATGPAAAITYAVTLATGIASVLANIAQAKKILGAGSGSDSSLASTAGSISNGVQPSGATNTDNTPRVTVNKVEPVKAFVTETDITRTQRNINSIEETSKI